MPTSPSVMSPPTGVIPPIYARQLRMLLQQAALDGDRALAAAQLDWSTLLTDDSRLSSETVTRLVNAAIEITRKPWLGLDLAASVPVTAHGPLGYAVVTALDLGVSLAVMARYGALRNDAFAWTLTTSEHGVTVQSLDNADWGAARGFIADMVMGSVLHLIEAALGQLPNGIVVDTPLAAPRWAAQYGRFGPVTVRFAQPALAFHVSHAALAQPCLGADAHAHAAALRECEAAWAEFGAINLSARVARLLADAPAGNYPQLNAVAALCGRTPRPWMRHLRAEGTSFQAMLDTARQSRALWLLQNTAQSVEEIAAQLGYVDTSNFSRTMRRWTGSTPRQLRAHI